MATNKKAKAKADTKPDKGFNAIGQEALKAQGLADQYKSEIGARLPDAFRTSFAADIVALASAVPAAINSKQGQVQLTATQDEQLASAHKLVIGVRTTVKAQSGDKDVLMAYGVGSKSNKTVVKDVTAALQQILDRIAAQPAEAAAFDLVADDVQALTDALAAVVAADQTQEAARAKKPLSTKERNAAARRLLDGVKKIAGAGMRTFRNDATVYANFAALISTKGA